MLSLKYELQLSQKNVDQQSANEEPPHVKIKLHMFLNCLSNQEVIHQRQYPSVLDGNGWRYQEVGWWSI